MKEISRQSMYHVDEGMACGPVGITAIDAEIVVDDNGEKVYLSAQWVDAVSDEIRYLATKESTYAVYEKINNKEGDFETLIEERDRIEKRGKIEDDERFEPFYAELKGMVIDELKKHDMEDWIEDLEEDEDEDE